MKMFLCPHCHALEEYVMEKTWEIWYRPYYPDDATYGDAEYGDTEESVYLCPECDEEVYPDEWLVEVDLDRNTFTVPDDSEWSTRLAEAITAMKEHGYEYEDGWDDDEDEDEEDEGWEVQGHDVFINEEEVWKV